MALVPLASVAEGARLSQPVKDDLGRLLVPAGEVLTAATLAILARRGIQGVAVEGGEGPPAIDWRALESQARTTPAGTALWERLAREAARWGPGPRMDTLRAALLRHAAPPAQDAR